MLDWRGDQVKSNVARATELAINETLIAAVTISKELVPRRTTILQGSIQMRPAAEQGGILVGEFGSYNNNYAIHVEFGTAPHEIVPKNAKALHWVDAGGADVFAKRVHHPGSRAHPFLRPAADREFPNLADRIRARLA